MQLNPRRPHGALAVLSNGALVLLWIPETAFLDDDDDTAANTNANATITTTALLYTLYDAAAVTCAALDPYGNRVYAATETGQCLAWNVEAVWPLLEHGGRSRRRPPPPPAVEFGIGGGARVWHLAVSRNGKFLVLNSADGAIRLYNTERLWSSTTGGGTTTEGGKRGKGGGGDDEKDDDADNNDDNDPTKPVHVFQDVVTKVKFASADLSGDAEYIVGGANGADNKYELYIWNTSTGALMDKLTGQSTQLYSVAWHPTRSFLAVACADGLVDIWGPRINWTAFAPDFQALPMNVEYIEREDEFDVDENGKHLAAAADTHTDAPNDFTTTIDVTTIEPVPVFASDSEDEEDVFYFETKLRNALSGFKIGKKTKEGDD